MLSAAAMPHSLRPAATAATALAGLRLCARHTAQRRHWSSTSAPPADDPKKLKRQENLKEIRKDIDRGYFGDINEFQKCEGKLFQAKTDLTPSNESPVFAAMTGTALTGRDVVFPRDLMGRTTLLCVGFRDFSQPQIQSYVKPFLAEFGKNKALQAYQVSVIEKQVWRMLASIIRHSLKNQIPEALQDNFVQCSSDAAALKRELDIHNPLFGYVYLLDPKARIRWQAAGAATEAEVQTMLGLAKRLASK